MNRRVVIFGAGTGGMGVIRNLPARDQVVAVIDNDPNKQGNCLCGHPINSLSVLETIEYDVIVIASVYFDAIAAQLHDLDVPADRIERGISAGVPQYVPVKALGDFQPLVSVILPAYNRERLVSRAIHSVLKQTYRNLELLMIDDGSTDGTRTAGIEAADGDPRFTLVSNPHLGVSASRNTGLARAKGAWIAYLDSDNQWHEEYLSRMLAFFATGNYLTGYCASNVFENERGLCYLRFSPFDRLRLMRENYIDLNVFMHHQSLIDEFGPFDEAMTRLVDWDLVLRFTGNHPPFVMNAALVDYYVQPDMSRISNTESFEENLQIMKERTQITTTIFSSSQQS